MDDAPPSAEEVARLRRVANFQFGQGGAEALFGDVDDATAGAGPVGDLTVERTSSGRIEQLHDDGDRLAAIATNGRFVLSVRGARRIVDGLPAPRHRVAVGAESVEYVREGRNAFAKFVTDADPALRPGDETVVVHDGAVLGVGRAELSPDGMADFDTGVAVSIRHGAGD